MNVLTIFALGIVSVTSKKSLWDRMGGEKVIRPLCNDIYELHATDPITAPWFSPDSPWNTRTAHEVKEYVFTFFSAGIGGPHAYKGRSMAEAHKKMREQKPFTGASMHAIIFHVVSTMRKHGAGGEAEIEEVLTILESLKSHVLHGDKIDDDAHEEKEELESNATLANEDPSSSFIDTPLKPIATFLQVAAPRYLIPTNGLPSTKADFLALTLDDIAELFPLIFLLALPAIITQFMRKVRQAHDLDSNSEGLWQFSAVFYSRPSSIIAALPYVLSFVPGILSVVAAAWGGHWAWLVAVAGYVLVPTADLFLGEDSYNPTPEQEAALKKNVWFRRLLLAYTPSYIATIAFGVWAVSRFEYTLWEFTGITVGVGIAGGFGIGAVHELIHRPTKAELGSGIVATVFANYSHFWIEHLWGHHKRVATDEDPASSNIGDSLYPFFVRVITKSFSDAIVIERRFLKNRGKGLLSNRILIGYTASFIIASTIYAFFGLQALFFYLGQGVVVWLHIENANYIEHYGLRRRKIEGKVGKDGETIYERPGWFHAWDTADRLTNYMLFKIQRHPDHHTNAGRPFQILRTLSFSPTMPTGYAGMFVLSWFPPLFHAVMDPLVDNAYRKRAEIEAAGLQASVYPKGSNNMSSYFKREGEGFFVPGSSPYENANAEKDKASVWDKVDFNADFDNGAKAGAVVESKKTK